HVRRAEREQPGEARDCLKYAREGESGHEFRARRGHFEGSQSASHGISQGCGALGGDAILRGLSAARGGQLGVEFLYAGGS
ncbi:hypothetical protein, partial [Burkholderia sp. SIMBA_051]|uniref:hypothetical protein n=1 Tax=Burkholderia sp. SIMBA_051 TaxID=3085792 RepID=UPI0039783390